ncbi:transcription termination factor 3, mitochondrial-like [Saccoglossus kowalevskii]|uniref:mTERF domain-containing protein 1, mitochondrial-like n=1 Tax=Saccoglossus kowalevskii TaxID=10224 RepID=A0ABM0LYG9_SACKO|nr:PREDICTED: mTERF domain-containing protein 1, mitochondrial-like [Saccoglossus kowalevskii]
MASWKLRTTVRVLLSSSRKHCHLLRLPNTRMFYWMPRIQYVPNYVSWSKKTYCVSWDPGPSEDQIHHRDADCNGNKDDDLDLFKLSQFNEKRREDELNDIVIDDNDTEGKKVPSIRNGKQGLVTHKMFEDLDDEFLESIQPYITPQLPVSPTFATYVDQSETLSNLVKIGMDLSKVQKRWTFKDNLIKMDFDKDIKDKLSFLHHVGVDDSLLGKFLTKNPFILMESVDNLEARVAYLNLKNFTDEAISQIITRAPYFLNFSIKRIDNKLGFYRKELSLTGNETRYLITRNPKVTKKNIHPEDFRCLLLPGKLATVKRSIFALKEQMRFSQKEFKKMVLNQPKILQTGKFKLLSTFDYLHNTVGLKHKQFVQFPSVFRSSLPRIKERHQYLSSLGRAQYNPTQPGYVTLEKLAILPDDLFCKDIASPEMLQVFFLLFLQIFQRKPEEFFRMDACSG